MEQPQNTGAAVAEAVRAAIAARGTTQSAVAEATGIPRVTLVRRLTGFSSFTVDELARIAKVLETTPAELVA